MSQEFEKKVLEKLDNFEGRFDRIENTLEKNSEILNDHTEEFKKVNKVLDDHTEEFKKVNKVLNDHTSILNEHTEQFKKVRKDIYDINNKIIKNSQYLKEIDLVLEYNTKSIKKYNEENARKIDLSLKAYEQLNTKVKVNECMISNLKSKNFQNEIRINALEDQIKNISMIA